MARSRCCHRGDREHAPPILHSDSLSETFFDAETSINLLPPPARCCIVHSEFSVFVSNFRKHLLLLKPLYPRP